MNSYKKKIKSAIYIDSLIFFLNSVVGFLIIPIYLNFLSLKELGIYFSVLSLVSVVGLANIGLNLYAERKLSNDKLFFSKNVGKFLNTIQIFQYVLGVGLLIIGFLLSYYIGDILAVDIEYYENSKDLFLYLWSALVLSVLLGLNHSILRSRHDLVFMSLSLFSISILTALLNITFLYFGYGISGLGLSVIIAIVLVNTLITYRVFKKSKIFIFFPKVFLREYFYDGLGYIKKFQLFKISQVSKTSLFTVLLSNYGGQSIVAQYNLTNKIPQVIPTFLSKVVTNYFPSLSSHFELKEMEKARDVFKKIFHTGFFTLIFCTQSIYFLNEIFIELWVGGDKFIGDDIFILILLNFIILALLSFTGIVIQTSGKFEKLPIVSILEVVVFLALSYVLFDIFGLLGFFIGYVLSMSIGLIYSLFIINKIFGINVFKWMAESVKLSMPLIFLLSLAYMLATNFIDVILIRFIVMFVIFAFIYIVNYRKIFKYA
jgi:O-antigen/teichoic acid export membrane protein